MPRRKADLIRTPGMPSMDAEQTEPYSGIAIAYFQALGKSARNNNLERSLPANSILSSAIRKSLSVREQLILRLGSDASSQ